MSNPVIRVEQLGKRYRIGERQEPYRTLRESIVRAGTAPWRAVRSLWRREPGGRRRPNEIWAIRDVSFEVERGDVVGIIGRNGAGKSTLLRVLSRITEPTEGHADIRGRVGSFLEVGTGFHPELTGRENVFLNGAILGMRKAEIERRFDEIVAFAEVEPFIDTAVKHYSSGMYVRLAFAVAAHLEPDILMVDEVLAVGDLAFQRKCLGKMGEASKGGRTVLFVTHNMVAATTLCKWGLVLEEGRVACRGSIADAVSYYTNRWSARAPDTTVVGDADGNGFRLIHALDGAQFACGDRIVFDFEVAAPHPVSHASVAVVIHDPFDSPVAGTSSRLQKVPGPAQATRWRVRCDLGKLPLNSGFYRGSIWLMDERREHARFDRAFSFGVLAGDPFESGVKVPTRFGHFYWTSEWTIEAVEES